MHSIYPDDLRPAQAEMIRLFDRRPAMAIGGAWRHPKRPKPLHDATLAALLGMKLLELDELLVPSPRIGCSRSGQQGEDSESRAYPILRLTPEGRRLRRRLEQRAGSAKPSPFAGENGRGAVG